jgi:hypothetical protein
MKISRNLLLLSILLVIGTAESSLSDSDGYFCVGPGYLAYEFNDTSAPDSGHVLNIIYLGGEAGISAPVKVMLESFQTHGMKCGENSIEILAWDAIHIVDISNRKAPSIKAKISIEPGKQVEGFMNKNLGHWFNPYQDSSVVKLSVYEGPRLYELIINRSETSEAKNGGGIIYRHTKTEVVQKNPHGEIVKRLEIFEGTFEKTID